ncbi:MAG TPA: hypothetical protein VGM17_02455 [Rhizomicrobium sp.]|jgi:hypothetical protein
MTDGDLSRFRNGRCYVPPTLPSQPFIRRGRFLSRAGWLYLWLALSARVLGTLASVFS